MYKNNWLVGLLSMEIKDQKTNNSDYVIELGRCIRNIRKDLKMSIEEVAYRAGIDAQNLRKYELGKQEMKVSMLKRIADAMKLRVAEIADKVESNPK